MNQLNIEAIIDAIPKSPKSDLKKIDQLLIIKRIAKKMGFDAVNLVINEAIGRTGKHNRPAATVPNKNSKTGIPGIQAFYLDRGTKILYIVATWRAVDVNSPDGKTIAYQKQFSVDVHGLKGAIKKAIDARKEGLGIKPASYQEAFIRINQMIAEDKLVVRKQNCR